MYTRCGILSHYCGVIVLKRSRLIFIAATSFVAGCATIGSKTSFPVLPLSPNLGANRREVSSNRKPGKLHFRHENGLFNIFENDVKVASIGDPVFFIKPKTRSVDSAVRGRRYVMPVSILNYFLKVDVPPGFRKFTDRHAVHVFQSQSGELVCQVHVGPYIPLSQHVTEV